MAVTSKCWELHPNHDILGAMNINKTDHTTIKSNIKEVVKVLDFVVFLLFSYGFAHHYIGNISWKRNFFSCTQNKCVIQSYQICKNSVARMNMYTNKKVIST